MIPNEGDSEDEIPSDEEGVPETVFGSGSSYRNRDNGANDGSHSEDVFGIYELLEKRNNKTEDQMASPSIPYPPGFTPNGSEVRDNCNSDEVVINGKEPNIDSNNPLETNDLKDPQSETVKSSSLLDKKGDTSFKKMEDRSWKLWRILFRWVKLWVIQWMGV